MLKYYGAPKKQPMDFFIGMMDKTTETVYFCGLAPQTAILDTGRFIARAFS
jgi:hypothetical protein